MVAVTQEQCEARRKRCPGHAAIPMGILVSILLAMFGAIITAYLLNSAAIADNRTAIARTATEQKIRAESYLTAQEETAQRLKDLTIKIEAMTLTLAELRARQTLPQPSPPGKEPPP